MELWELTDKHGVPTGKIYNRASGKEIPEGYYFRVAEIWVRAEGEMLVTQRHPQKWAGLEWEVPGGGVVMGESPEEAAYRELSEEVGILAQRGALKLVSTMTHKCAIVYSFYLELDKKPEITLQESEVVDHVWADFDKLSLMKEKMTVGTSSRMELIRDFVGGGK